MPIWRSLEGLRIGMILAVFQIWGIILLLRDKLKSFVSRSVAIGPRCLRW